MFLQKLTCLNMDLYQVMAFRAIPDKREEKGTPGDSENDLKAACPI
jgi:hypothetical protein